MWYKNDILQSIRKVIVSYKAFMVLFDRKTWLAIKTKNKKLELYIYKIYLDPKVKRIDLTIKNKNTC